MLQDSGLRHLKHIALPLERAATSHETICMSHTSPVQPTSQIHSKRLVTCLHEAPLRHGLLAHQSIELSQRGPVKPRGQLHENEPWRLVQLAPLRQGRESQGLM